GALGVRVLGVRALRVGAVGRLRRGVLRGAGDLGAATVTGGRRLLVLRGAAGGEGEDESGDGGSGAEGAGSVHARYLEGPRRGPEPQGPHQQGQRCRDVKDSSAPHTACGGAALSAERDGPAGQGTGLPIVAADESVRTISANAFPQADGVWPLARSERSGMIRHDEQSSGTSAGHEG